MQHSTENSASKQVLLKANNVSLSFGSKKALVDVDLRLHSGEIVTLIGPNGAGKSTLVRVVLGLLKPDKGNIERAANIRLGYVPQKIHIDPFLPLSVRRFLELAAEKKLLLQTEEFKKLFKKLKILNLMDSPLQNISGGELARVMLARALIRKPDLLVLDEPTQGVDISGQEELYQLILDIRDQYHCGILMVSHDLHLVMAGTDSVVCLNKHVCCMGHPKAVSEHPAFLELFKTRLPERIAVYAHAHDHDHAHDHAQDHIQGHMRNHTHNQTHSDDPASKHPGEEES